jgi:hypothetical protein
MGRLGDGGAFIDVRAHLLESYLGFGGNAQPKRILLLDGTEGF